MSHDFHYFQTVVESGSGDSVIKRLQPTVKHGGYSAMVWSAILNDGRLKLVECQGNITSVKYVSILQEGLIPIFSSGTKNVYLLMEDGALCRSAKTHKIGCSKMGLENFHAQVSHQI